MTPCRLPTVTPLQFAYLEALYDGKKTGKEMRAKLSRRGVRKSPIAFYRTIRWLKNATLVTSSKSATETGGYLGPVCVYRLTKAGRDAVADARAFNDRQVSAHEAHHVPVSTRRSTKPSNNDPTKEAL